MGPTFSEDPLALGRALQRRRSDIAAAWSDTDAVVWDRAETMAGFGGIRIEDNIHVTPGGPENLTAAIPLL